MPAQRQGMSSASPLGLLLENSSAKTLLVRSSGTVTTPPTEWSTTRFGSVGAEMPDFSPGALLEGIYRDVPGVDGSSAAFLLSSMSSGGDVCGPIATDGKMTVSDPTGDETWYVLSATLGAKPAGSTYGRVDSALRAPTNGAGMIASYYFEGSQGMDAAIVDSSMIEQTSDQIGFGTTAVDLLGIDWGIGAISTDPSGNRTSSTSPVRDRFFFTVTDGWESTNDDHYFIEDQDVHLLESDNVYGLEWKFDSTSGQYQWSSPFVAFSDKDLFGSIDSGHSIDAISVYWKSDTVQRLVYSTEVSAGTDQILGFDRTAFAGFAGTMPVALATENGEKIVDRIGLDVSGQIPDDVKGLCGMDPESGIISSGIGTPLEQTTGSHPSDMGLALYRGSELNGAGNEVDTLTIHITGLDTIPGQDTHLIIDFGFFNPSTLPIDNSTFSFFYLDPVIVPAGATTFSIPLPGNLGLNHTAIRARHFINGAFNRQTLISGINL